MFNRNKFHVIIERNSHEKNTTDRAKLVHKIDKKKG